MRGYRIRIGTGAAALGLLAVLTGCDLPNGGRGRSNNPVVAMLVPAPEGNAKPVAAGHNADGIDHMVREHWSKAAADFRRALASDPMLAAAHFNLALALDQLGARAEAETEFAAALRLAPDDARIARNELLNRYLPGAGQAGQ